MHRRSSLLIVFLFLTALQLMAPARSLRPGPARHDLSRAVTVRDDSGPPPREAWYPA